MSKFDGIHNAPYNPNNPFSCCYGCEKRFPACSDTCEEHAKAVKIRAEQRRLEKLNATLGRAEKMRAMRNARNK